MQALTERSPEALKRDGGQLLMRYTVEHIHVKDGKATGVVIRNQNGEVSGQNHDHRVANVTVQNLLQLLGEKAPLKATSAPGKKTFAPLLCI